MGLTPLFCTTLGTTTKRKTKNMCDVDRDDDDDEQLPPPVMTQGWWYDERHAFEASSGLFAANPVNFVYVPRLSEIKAPPQKQQARRRERRTHYVLGPLRVFAVLFETTLFVSES